MARPWRRNTPPGAEAYFSVLTGAIRRYDRTTILGCRFAGWSPGIWISPVNTATWSLLTIIPGLIWTAFTVIWWKIPGIFRSDAGPALIT